MLKSQWRHIIKGFNENAIVPEDEWNVNTKANMDKLHASNSVWKMKGMFFPPDDKAVVIVGASPCLKRDVEKLKACDDDFSVFCVNSALKFMLDHGVKPDFVVALDSDDEDIYSHLDVDSKDLTLIASNVVSPRVLDKWQGKIWFMPYYGATPDLNRKVRGRLGKTVPIGGNALGTTVAMAIEVFYARIIVLAASECCYDKQYYPSKTIARNNAKPTEFFVKDINGNNRVTTVALHTYKLWLERLALEVSPKIKIIDTSEGILGRREDRSYIYTYELSDIIGRIKEAANKKREIINDNPTLFNPPVHTQGAGQPVHETGS